MESGYLSLWTGYFFRYKKCWLECENGILTIFDVKKKDVIGKIHLRISDI